MMTSISIADGFLLVNGASIQELPRLALPATVTVWVVPTDYIASGFFVDVREAGQPAGIPACASSDAAVLGQVELPADDGALAAAAKAERLALANAEADELLAELDRAYPEREVLTWDQQLKEAEALMADSEAPAPLLRQLALSRSIGIADLATRVIAKSNLYKAAAGNIMGARQWVEDQLDEAAGHEAVLAVPAVSGRLLALQEAQ
ncbi:hypothetical protein H0A70_05070 [Alcaligenaceae bacterium]|nr:hypothetical protein [Alcaligenaceae bacterium]